MHALHVISSLDARAGGPTTALAGLAGALSECGVNVSIIATFTGGENRSVGEALQRRGASVEWVGPCRWPLRWHPRLARLIRQSIAGANIVHIHGLWEQVQHASAIAARRNRIPYIIRPCGMLDPWSLRQSRLRKKLYLTLRTRDDLNRAAAIHFTTDIERDLTGPLKLKAPAIIEPNGVDLSEFSSLPPRGSFRAEHGIAPDKPLLLFMSRIHHKKGLDVLVPAFAKMKTTDAMLAIAGPDSDGYQAIVGKMAVNAGVRNRVMFLGMLQGPARIAALADADLFVLPSYQENFGIVVVEALAAGTPVVISDQVNLYPDVLSAGVGGVVPMDAEKLAAEIDRWLANANMRHAAGQKAKAFAVERYDWSQIAKRWVRHYAKLVK